MTAKELYELEDFEDFISEFEGKWLQYTTEQTKVKSYFGSVKNGLELFEKWKQGYELFGEEKAKAFPEMFRIA
jgi:hypothetical protein